MTKLKNYSVDWDAVNENMQSKYPVKMHKIYIKLLHAIESDEIKNLTYRNIADALSISSTCIVHHHVHKLIEKGFLKEKKPFVNGCPKCGSHWEAYSPNDGSLPIGPTVPICSNRMCRYIKEN